MPLYVNTNVASLFAQRHLNGSQASAEKSLERLSTGLRINSAADDAAGLAISNRFRSRVRSLEQSQRNANDGISVIQTAEGSLEQMGQIMDRLREIGYANVGDFIDHVDHAVDLIGIDHVGLSSDFDGGGGIVDWFHAGETFNVTLELVRRGYSRDDIEKLWGGNLLRVWREVEEVAAESG